MQKEKVRDQLWKIDSEKSFPIQFIQLNWSPSSSFIHFFCKIHERWMLVYSVPSQHDILCKDISDPAYRLTLLEKFQQSILGGETWPDLQSESVVSFLKCPIWLSPLSGGNNMAVLPPPSPLRSSSWTNLKWHVLVCGKWHAIPITIYTLNDSLLMWNPPYMYLNNSSKCHVVLQNPPQWFVSFAYSLSKLTVFRKASHDWIRDRSKRAEFQMKYDRRIHCVHYSQSWSVRLIYLSAWFAKKVDL